MIVSQMINKKGNSAKNQFIITTNNAILFQSYNTAICKIENNITFIDPEWNCSVTTLKHLKIFLDVSLSKNDIQKRIDNGSYRLTNLN
jgi:hypothetical protein